MAPFSSRFITSARRTWESSLRTVVGSTVLSSELERLTSVHHSHYPCWHTGDGLMLGRKRFLLSFWNCMCFILSAITAVGHPSAIVGPWGTKTHFPLHPVLSRVARGTLESTCGVVRWYRDSAHPLSAWLIGRTSEAPDPRWSWAGVLGASGRGIIMPSVSALHLANPQAFGAPGWLALV